MPPPYPPPRAGEGSIVRIDAGPAALVLRAEGALRRTRLRERGPERQPAPGPTPAAIVGLPAARLRHRDRAPLSKHLRDHGADRTDRHVAEPHGIPADLSGARGRPVPSGPGAAVHPYLR